MPSWGGAVCVGWATGVMLRMNVVCVVSLTISKLLLNYFHLSNFIVVFCLIQAYTILWYFHYVNL